MEDFTKVLGTKRKLFTVYHSQTDRQTERINQEIGMFLRYYVNYNQDDWTEWLAMAEFAYNDKKHMATNKTPLERGPYGSNKDITSKGIHEEHTKKLGTCSTSNERSSEKHETAVQQKEKEPSRPEGWRPCVAGEQKISSQTDPQRS